MPFKKNDEKTKIAGRIGGKRTQRIHPETSKNLELGRRGKTWRKYNANIEHQRNAGRASRFWENKAIETMKNEYDKIFLPQTVCDRICIKNGKIIFVEVKRVKNGKLEKLRPLQKEFKNLCEKLGYKYEILTIGDGLGLDGKTWIDYLKEAASK